MHRPDRPYRALLLIGASAFFFSWMQIFVKRLSLSGFPGFETVFFRLFLNCLFVTAVMRHRRETFFPKGDRPLLFFRGLCGFVSVCALFYSLAHLPLPVASMLYWSSPLFVIFFSRFTFKEALPRGAAPLALVALAGLALLLKLDPRQISSAYPPLAVGVGILGSVSGAFAYLAVRAATRRVGVNGIIFAFTFTGTVLALPFAAAHFEWPSALQWLWIGGLGVAAIAGQYFMTEGYRHAPAGVVSTMNLLNAGFAALWGWSLFGESLDPTQWAGLLVVVAALGLLTLASGNAASKRV